MRKLSVGLAVALLTGAILVVTPQPALAACGEQTIFWRGNPSAYGAWNEIRTSDRDLGTCGQFETWSTAHVALGGNFGNWVEVGWEEGCCNLDGSHYWWWFAEWGLNYNTQGYDEGPAPCLAGGVFADWKATNVPGTTNWNFYLDCGSGWSLLKSFSSTTYSHSIATGETGRFGGTATGMSEYQRSLKYKNNSGNWVSWSYGPSCYQDNASNWDGRFVSSTSYDTYKPQTDLSCFP